MALWGNKDSKAVAGTISVTNGSKNVTGSSTTFTALKNGQTLVIAGTPYKIGNISSNTALTLIKNYAGSTAAGLTVTANESPVFANGARPYPSQPYGVEAGEQEYGSSSILQVVVTNGGTGYVEEPVPSVDSEDGSGLSLDVTISGGAVTAIDVTDIGYDYRAGDELTIPLARITIPTSGVATSTDIITYTGHGLADLEAIKYVQAGLTAITNLTDGSTYYVSAIGRTANTFRLASSLALADGNGNLSTVVISGTGGQFTCAAATLAVGDRVQITGTLGGTGSITGYATGNVYRVSAVTGSSPNVTGFTLQTEASGAIVTTAGTPTGLTYLTGTVIDLGGTGNSDQYFEKSSKTAATGALVFGPGDSDSGNTAVSAPGWVVVTTGTGGRAGRRTYETLAVVREMGVGSDASDDTVFPED